MNLFPELNREQTKNNAKRILSKYRKYRAYMNAPINPRVTSSFGDGMPGTTAPRLEYTEQRVLNAEKGEMFCHWIDWAIENCRKYQYKELLKIAFCEGYEESHEYYMNRLVQRLPEKYYEISPTTYFNWYSLALLDVAERLECQVFKDDK